MRPRLARLPERAASMCVHTRKERCARRETARVCTSATGRGSLSATQGTTGPVSLVEPTSNGTTNVNYDVSPVNGYNVQTAVQPSVPASGANCYAPSCTSDLNASCPANLQITEAPTSASGPIPCGSGTFCQSGACVNGTCVVGCNDPIDQCQTANPPAGLLSIATLKATSANSAADIRIRCIRTRLDIRA